MWQHLLAELRRGAWASVFIAFGGYLIGIIILGLLSLGFHLKNEVTLVEILTLGFSIFVAIGIPLLLKRLTSDADARRTLFMGDVEELLRVYEDSAKILQQDSSMEEVQASIRLFFSESEQAKDLINKGSEHLGRFAIPSSLKDALKRYEILLGEPPFQEGFTLTDILLTQKEELLHTIKVEIRKYQYEILLQ